MAVRAKVLEFEAAIDADGELSAESCPPIELAGEWEAEHLLLAALLRCSLASLRYHAKRVGAVARGGGSANGTVTKRESDGRYAFVELRATLDVSIEPAPSEAVVAELLAKAERDCFIAATLVLKPDYEWRVNGVTARAGPW